MKRAWARLLAGGLLVASGAGLRANDFTVAPNISGGFGNFHWDIAVDDGATMANPPLTIYTGQTYSFNVSTTPTHPFWIKTIASTGSANAYTGGGLSANGVTTTTTITFDVPANAPATLHYDCGNHPEMTGTITVIQDLVFRDGFEGP